jgi:hypothetical protein
MNPFAHFEDQFWHLQLSDNDAALHVFLAGWNSAMMEMMQRVNKMPFGDDTRASFAVYFQSQMVNVDAIEKPEQKEPVAVVSGYYGGQCVILPTDPARIYNSNTPLYTAPQLCPTCEALARTVMLDQTSHDAQRKPLTITEESAWDLASYVYARSNPHESPQILLSAMEIKQIIEAAHGIKENT